MNNFEFMRYPSLKRFGTEDVSGIEHGNIYVFPKLDGTNASVWLDENGEVQAGSRNRHLDETSKGDNAGFCKWAKSDLKIKKFLEDYPHLRLFGEWLVPHSLKTYRESAWRKFYIFDIFNETTERFLSYHSYKELLSMYELDFVPCVYETNVIDLEKITHLASKNTYLIEENSGIGEGLVIKNYDFVNKFGRTTWAKYVTNEFKEKNSREFGHQVVVQELIEETIIEEFCTEAFIEKEYSKMVLNEPWTNKRIPELLGRVWHTFLEEETVNFVKKHRNPLINFKTLNFLLIQKIKKVKADLF